VVIANGHADPLREALAGCDFEGLEVQFEHCGSNLGFGAGHSLTYASLEVGQWMWVMNPDLMVDPGWFERAAQQLEALPDDVAVAAPTVITPSGPAKTFHRPVGFAGIIRYLLGAFGLRRVVDRGYCRRNNDPELPYVSVYGVNGACFAVRRVARDFEPFDPRVFMFFEEQILAERVRRSGFSTVQLENVVVQHDVGGTRKAMNRTHKRRLRSSFVRSERLYLDEYLEWPRALVSLVGAITRCRLLLAG
jgi:GT2 family glycosyltransferase